MKKSAADIHAPRLPTLCQTQTSGNRPMPLSMEVWDSSCRIRRDSITTAFPRVGRFAPPSGSDFAGRFLASGESPGGGDGDPLSVESPFTANQTWNSSESAPLPDEFWLGFPYPPCDISAGDVSLSCRGDGVISSRKGQTGLSARRETGQGSGECLIGESSGNRPSWHMQAYYAWRQQLLLIREYVW